MNLYHLKIIDGISKGGFTTIVKAERIEVMEKIFYGFIICEKSKTGRIPVDKIVAYYPINNTIVESIETIQ